MCVRGSWKLETGDWRMETGDWKLETGNWKLETGNWKLETGNWKLEIRIWKLETGSWKLETGNWKLETGNWKHETGKRKIQTIESRTKKEQTKNKIINIVEKPKKTKSNLAVTGLYFFDNKVVKFSKSLKPSNRKEIEIVDLLNKYKNARQLNSELIGRGGAWLDTGSIKDFNDTSNFVATIENRQGFKIGCLEEIAFQNKWIKKNDIKKAINFYGNCEYSDYISKLIK